MRVLDLFCGAGGAGKGYQKAGFSVTGIDIHYRFRYCGKFVQDDAMDMLRHDVERIRQTYAFIHASPPCQAGCTLTNGTNANLDRNHPQYIPELRELLNETGLPYVIEQPSGHGGLIRTDLKLCMDMFPIGPPPWVQRHRDFEIHGFAVPQPEHPKHRGHVRGYARGLYRDGPYVAAYGKGGGKATVAEMQHAMQIDWTHDRKELTEAIPPAYTEHIGKAFQDMV